MCTKCMSLAPDMWVVGVLPLVYLGARFIPEAESSGLYFSRYSPPIRCTFLSMGSILRFSQGLTAGVTVDL